MFSRIFLANVVLAAIVVFLGVKTYGVWVRATEPAGEVAPVRQAAPERRAYIPKRMPPAAEFQSVSERNLFSPERKPPVQPEPESESEPEITELAIPGKKISVHGIVITDGRARALVSNPKPKAGERPDVWVQEGDDLADFRVAEIKTDRLILSEGAKRYEVLLYDTDSSKQAKRAERGAEPTVVTTETRTSQETAPQNASAPKTPKPSKGDVVELVTPFGKLKRKVQ